MTKIKPSRASRLLDEDELFEMSNLRPEETGISGVAIWVSAGEFEGKDSRHGPRVKVVIGGGTVNKETLSKAPSVVISYNPRLIRGTLKGKIEKQVFAFIKINLDVLLSYWNQEIGTKAMVNLIKGISND